MFIHRLASIAARGLGPLVVLGAAALLAACADAPRGSTELPPGVKTLRVNGYDLAYAERGSGVPLVLVHGALNDYRAWEPQMGPFGERYRVYALSMRHYYPERWNGQGTTFKIYLPRVDAAADHPLAGHKRVTPEELGAWPWIFATRGGSHRARLEQFFRMAGREPPRPQIECASIQFAKAAKIGRAHV